MSHDPYASLIKAFVALVVPDQPPLTEAPGTLQMTVDEQPCTVFPVDPGSRVALQAEVLELSALGAGDLSAALRLLHGLNWATAVGSGIMILIDDRDRVLVSSVHEIIALDASRLSERMADLLAAASSLKAVLEDLKGARPSAGASMDFRPPDPGPLGNVQLV